MGIYINMEMPTSCFYCFARQKIDPDNIRCLVTGDVFEETFAGTIEKRMSSCPLVPVPQHGRLIDENNFFSVDIVYSSKQFEEGMRAFVSDMPTIIPAEEGK